MLSTQLQWLGIRAQKVVVHHLLDLTTHQTLLAVPRWSFSVDGMVQNFSMMFTSSISKLWLGQNHQPLDQLQVQERAIAQFWLVQTWLSMVVSGLTMTTWRKLEAKIKDPHYKSATLMISEYSIQKHLFGLVLELVDHHQNIDLVTQWTFPDQIFFCSEDGQKHLVQDLSMNQLKRVATTSWYGPLIQCPGSVANTLEILQQVDSDTPVPPSVHTCLSLEAGNTPKHKMR